MTGVKEKAKAFGKYEELKADYKNLIEAFERSEKIRTD